MLSSCTDVCEETADPCELRACLLTFNMFAVKHSFLSAVVVIVWPTPCQKFVLSYVN